MKYRTLLLSCFFFIIGMMACKHTHAAEDKKGKEYTSEYICPMRCEGSGSHEMGKCPACKMDYVINDEAKHQGGNEHDGHDHGQDGHNHDH